MIKKCKRCARQYIAKTSKQEFCGQSGCKKPSYPLKPKKKILPKKVVVVKPIAERKDSIAKYVGKYGITLEDYLGMVCRQGGRCAICGATSDRLMIDHCHKSTKVRGLLCGACNTGLGMFRDNVSALNAAIIYLTRGE